jgi:hypothetical protein
MTKLGVFVASIVIAAIVLGCGIAVLDDRSGQMALGIFEPAVNVLSYVGELFTTSAQSSIPVVIVLISCVLTLGGIGRPTEPRAQFFLGLIIAIVSEYSLLIAKSIMLGTIGYAAAIACWALALSKRSSTEPSIENLQAKKPFSKRDAALLIGIVLLALFFRIYAVNRILNTFEGELAPYAASATSLTGIFVANRGVQWWAPLGLLYYLPIYLTTTLYGTTLTTLRLSSAMVGVATIPLVYIFARRVGGNATGLLASLFVALDYAHIGWGRTDVHPHGVTTWPALLICISFLRAFEFKRHRDFAILALCMALSVHQYPSGQSAVAIPLIAAFLVWLSHRSLLPTRGRQIGWIVLGILLWVLGPTLSYLYPEGSLMLYNPLTLPGKRTLWNGLSQAPNLFQGLLSIAYTALIHVGDILSALFFKAKYIHHQDYLADVDGIAPHIFPWLLAPFAVTGIAIAVRFIRRPEMAVALAWIIAATLPAIFAKEPYPKRMSTLLPALYVVTSLAVIFVMSLFHSAQSKWRKTLASATLSIGVCCMIAFDTKAWFKSWRLSYGAPPDIKAVESLKHFITPNSVVISELTGGYYFGKITYLLLDHLSSPGSRPNIWLTLNRGEMAGYIEDPLRALHFDHTWPYLTTKLRDTLDEASDNNRWSQIVFVLQERPTKEGANQQDIDAAMNRCFHPRISRIEAQGSFWLPLVIVQCEITDLKPLSK